MKRTPKAKSRRRALRGRGSVGDWFKKAIGDIGSFLKRHKVISSVGDWATRNLVSDPKLKELASLAVNAARKEGWGKKQSPLSALKAMNQTLRSKKYVSRGLHGALKSGLVPAAHLDTVRRAHEISRLMGYGRGGSGIRLAGGALRLAGARKY